MPLNMNFDTPLTLEQDGGVIVTGTSEPIDETATMVSRRVVLRQGVAFDEGDAPGDPIWNTLPLKGNPPLGEFGPGEALAMGTEVFVVDNSANQGVVATMVTVTWSQTITLKKA